MRTERRVVVTGLGIICPLGNSVAEAWEAILAGHSAAAPISHFDAENFSTRFAAEVKDFDAKEQIGGKEVRRMDTFIQFGVAAGIQALEDSGLGPLEGVAGERSGVSMGSGIGGMKGIEESHLLLQSRGPRRISPFFVPTSISNMISGQLSIRYGLRGPNFTLVTACSSGAHSIGFAARSISYGEADVMVAGGAEMATTPLSLAGFCSAKALSTRNEDPQAASRPWDRDRDGFLMGEGAAALVLEEYQHARARGATIYAECKGFGMSSDAFHITAPPENGAGAALAMKMALEDAAVNASDVAYINAHGTSTPVGDVAETRAIKQVFDHHVGQLMVSSTKSMIGHLLGAAGAVEALVSALVIRDGVVPPTINLDNPDPECDLDYVPGETRRLQVDNVLSNSFGFGGTNASLVFSKL